MLSKDQPVVFLGVADFIQHSNTPFPVGGIDIFQLSQHKSHIIYPALTQANVWVLLVKTEFLIERDLSKWELIISDEDDVEFGRLNFKSVPQQGRTELQPKATEDQLQDAVAILDGSEFAMINFKVDAAINHPGKYGIYSNYEGSRIRIGTMCFHYRRSPSLTPDQIIALKSDPSSIKAIRFELGCKFCATKVKTYTALNRDSKLEREGCVWQTELADEFSCECGKTNYSLQYLKESMHGLLLKDYSRDHTGLGYIRRYAHSQVKETVGNFTKLLDVERLEQPVQEFIEQHPVLLSRFHAKRLFVKPDILGRFQADFAVVDSRGQLWFIELEKPSLQLFKRDGHPTQALMHAYGQVTDWLHQYSKYSGAILDALGLATNDVVTVRGAVIAGRSADVTHEVLQRHLSNPPYPNIEFMTCDDLGVSLLEISKKIA